MLSGEAVDARCDHIKPTTGLNLSKETISRLVLGTAQIGMVYGVCGRQIPAKEAAAIFRKAEEAGIIWLDTAQHYGDAEEKIGQFLQKYPESRFKVISKLHPDIDLDDPDSVNTAIRDSRDRIGRPLAGMLYHRSDRIDLWPRIYEKIFAKSIARGDVAEVGISVYTPQEFSMAINMEGVDMIQAPFNVFDRRLLDLGLIDQARKRGIRVFLRSAFLQGLLVMDPEDLPPNMAFAANHMRLWQKTCRDHCIRSADAALRFIADAVPDAHLVVGCETTGQLMQSVDALRQVGLDSHVMNGIRALPQGDDRLVDPRIW